MVRFSNTPPPPNKGTSEKIFEEKKKQEIQPDQAVKPAARSAVPSKGAESAYRALKKVEGLVEAGTRRPLIEIGKSINFDAYNNALVEARVDVDLIAQDNLTVVSYFQKACSAYEAARDFWKEEFNPSIQYIVARADSLTHYMHLSYSEYNKYLPLYPFLSSPDLSRTSSPRDNVHTNVSRAGAVQALWREASSQLKSAYDEMIRRASPR